MVQYHPLQYHVLNELVTYFVNFLHPTLLLVGVGNFLINTGIIQGHLLTMNERPFFNIVRLISLHGSKERYLLTNLARSKFGVSSCLISFLMLELAVPKGFDYKC